LLLLKELLVAADIFLLAFCSAVLAVGKFEMGLGIDELRTLAFVALVFGSQAPRCQRSHNPVFSAAVNPRRNP